MWVTVLGPAGSCKRAVVDELVKKDGFLFERETLVFSDRPTVQQQGRAICERWKMAISLTKRQEEADYLTIRSFWNSEIYLGAMHECRMITEAEFETLTEFYQTMVKAVAPPHAAIYLKTTPMQAQARCALTGNMVSDEFEGCVRRRYDEHVEKMNLSVVRIENDTEQFENVLAEVRSAMNDFRASNIGQPSVWKRSYYK